ncbi:MAG TPA: hypothetical protein DGT58_04670 [Erysipelotrichaceae bacterium]|nr:hypothetical protein [Erysipelotrichaceae bacterium]
MDENLVTIVIPTYHRPDRITRAVDSALKQTCDVEVFVVDDNGKGSAEQLATENALKESGQITRIHYLINEKNGGGSYSRNQGLKQAHGEFITFLDDDDEIAPDKLEKQRKCLRDHGDDYSCCYCSYYRLNSDGGMIRNAETIEGYVYPWTMARSVYVGSGSNLLVRTSSALAIGGYDESFRFNQDLEFLTRLTKIGKLAYLDEDLLTIHYEIREIKRDYPKFLGMDQKYLETFGPEIDKMNERERNAVYWTIALERWRHSIPDHMQKDAIANMKKCKVPFSLWLRYTFYLADRVINKKSYGFKAIKPQREQIHG